MLRTEDRNILVIDDDEAIRRSFALAFEGTAYQVIKASSGEQGIEIVSGQLVDLIFLDLKMPGMDGVQTLRELRKIDAEVPVYIVTAFHKDFLDPLKAVAEDGIEFELMSKPVGHDQIIAVTKGVLG